MSFLGLLYLYQVTTHTGGQQSIPGLKAKSKYEQDWFLEVPRRIAVILQLQ